ncbi:hypothetical protein WJM97_01245 [Okeanomitos corallinicola TIOX110]|uniref:Toxin co-regulated pilus biosynthesis protein Q C-terminal domain-containing protein n=1 Tax=Okeanomitos corallinicola TIOX110 TaxID=3133117 RepID=A0ABZ2UTR4_9CYAN
MLKFNFVTHQKSLSLILRIFSFSLTTLAILPIYSSQAENIPLASNAPLELSLLNEPNGSVITADTIASQGLTIPSLWWAKQISENKLLDNWIAYPASVSESARVDLIVNQQIWSLLDYLERYKFVNKVGTIARGFGYNIRVFNYQQELLATYTCNLDVKPDLCNIKMNFQSRLGLTQTSDF